MNKIFKTVFNKGKEIVKQTASDIASQSIENVKFAVTDKVNNTVNQSIQSVSDKAGLLFKKQKDIIEEDIVETTAEVDDTIYKDEDAFENSIRGGLEGMVSSLAAGNPEEAKEVLNNFVTMAGEVQKFTEVQKTKRKDIEAKRDIIVERIKSQKEIILSYLEKTFDERKENFSKLFSIVDNAIENNNIQQLALSLDSINKLADSSPFKALASIESVSKALEDKNHEWDF
jgi:hypothetical protein